jgi:predicted house-cleaning NTP pyrophosphatase (Maf/HAM1 superfamily)
MVKEIKGSYANVVGLPICEVAEAFLSLGVFVNGKLVAQPASDESSR